MISVASDPMGSARAGLDDEPATRGEPIRIGRYRDHEYVRRDRKLVATVRAEQLALRPHAGKSSGAVMETSGREPGASSRMGKLRKWQKQPKTVATGCDRLPFGSHGKEGVNGSTPLEGSAKAPETGTPL